MKRLITLVLTAAIAVFGPSTAAHADSAVTHLEIHDSEVSVSDFDAGDEPGRGACLPFSGTSTEYRDLDAKLVIHEDGETHIEFTVQATFTLTPDDPSRWPSYSGSYREQGAGRTFLTPEGEVPVVFSFHLQPSATGSDGSQLRALLKGHVTVTPDGTVRVTTDTLRCIESP
jgi:hypothetical protein